MCRRAEWELQPQNINMGLPESGMRFITVDPIAATAAALDGKDLSVTPRAAAP